MANQLKKKWLDQEVISYFDDQIDVVESGLAQEIVDRTSSDASIQSELDATQVGAGLEPDGSYVPNVGTFYISTATSLKEATEFLDDNLSGVNDALQVEIAERQSGDTSTYNDAVAYTDQEIAALETSLQAEVGDLQTQINNVLSNVDGAALDSLTEIVTAFQAADASLNGAITSLSTGLSADIDAEEAARIAADSALQGEIDAEEIARAAADVTLQNNIDAESSARQSADSALDSRVTVLENALVPTWAPSFKKDLDATDISNGYVDLPHQAVSGSVIAFVDRLAIHETEEFTVSVVGGVTRITFTGPLVSPGQQSLDANDNIYVKYQYLA